MDILMTEPLSLLGAQAARKMLAATDYERGYAVRDALADLMHYCAAEGVDFENELRVARANVAEEQEYKP